MLAAHSVKRNVFTVFPNLKAFYRILYNGIALLLLILFFLFLPADVTLYKTSGSLFVLLAAIQISAAGLAVLTLKGYGSEFLGFRQIRRYVSLRMQPGYLDEPEKGELRRRGFYRYMRHPLYTFAMIILLASPAMTANLLFFTLLTGIYFYTGSFFEERNLIKRFGDNYVTYQAQVPRFLPRISTLLNSLVPQKNR